MFQIFTVSINSTNSEIFNLDCIKENLDSLLRDFHIDTITDFHLEWHTVTHKTIISNSSQIVIEIKIPKTVDFECINEYLETMFLRFQSKTERKFRLQDEMFQYEINYNK